MKYKVVIDGKASYIDDYQRTVESVAWCVFHAREYNTDHDVVGKVIDNATSEVMYREEYKVGSIFNKFGEYLTKKKNKSI